MHGELLKMPIRKLKTGGFEYYYSITHRNNGEFACDCPAFMWSKKKPPTCKHIKELNDYLNTNFVLEEEKEEDNNDNGDLIPF